MAGQVAFQRGNLMTEACKLNTGIGTMNRRGNGCHGVGVAEYMSLGADLHGIAADIHNGGDDTQGVEHASGSSVLTVDLTDAVLKGNLPVLFPEG